MKISNQLKTKLQSENGASLMVALLFFVMCASVGSIILAAASASAGRISKVDTLANRQRYALISAAQLIEADMNDSASMTFPQQNWTLRTYRIDTILADTDEDDEDENDSEDAADSKESAGKVNENHNWIISGDTSKAGGNYILPVDLTEVPVDDETYYNYDGLEKLSYAWKQDPMYEDSISDTKIDGSKLTNGFSDVRQILADKVYRHYWNQIAQGTDQEGGDYFWSSDINGTSVKWSSIAKSEPYQVGMDGLRITLNEQDHNRLVPVYMDITMDQDFKITARLYPGTEESTDKTAPDLASLRDNALITLYLTVPGDGTITYGESQTEKSWKMDDNDDDNDDNNREDDDDTGEKEYLVITDTSRHVSMTLNWQKCSISTLSPETADHKESESAG